MNQADKESTDAAITAHTKWLGRLRQAIETGTSEFEPEIVKVDSSCEFGKWLHGNFPEHLKGTAAFEEVRVLHARFHTCAARVLQLAISGKTSDAITEMLSSGEFMTLSCAIMMKLRALRKL